MPNASWTVSHLHIYTAIHGEVNCAYLSAASRKFILNTSMLAVVSPLVAMFHAFFLFHESCASLTMNNPRLFKENSLISLKLKRSLCDCKKFSSSLQFARKNLKAKRVKVKRFSPFSHLVRVGFLQFLLLF